MKKVSVIIPTYNSWNTLKSCIASVQNQIYKAKEIIVVNNGSSDGTAVKVKKEFPKVKLINLNKNTGVTGGRNTGIKHANSYSDYLFFFDHDMVAERNMLAELVKVAELSKEIGIVTPKIYYFGNKKRIWSAGTGINLWTGQILFRGGEDVGQYEKVEEVQVAPAALLVKRELIKKLKCFDNHYFVTYEDTDFCFRAREIGFKTFYAPKALAYHKISWYSKDDVDRVLSRAYFVGRNRLIFMKKFGKNIFIFSAFLPVFCVYYLYKAAKNKNLNGWFEFMKGTFDGFLD
ncbi:glycosyltransferase family 2 protein [Candidatus Daviesbacteria bacterium]|nr:glycosyltransferase family 2 protein [Candidatus Daviesbacteria bacterium]